MTLQFDTTAMTGMHRDAVESAWTALVAAASRHEYGGVVALVLRDSRIVLHRATGWAIREPVPLRIPMAIDTIFDVASLTKVTATTPAILQLITAGKLELDQPVGEILSEFGTDGPQREITIRRLLTHTAGFRDWIPHFLEEQGADAYLRKFAATQPEFQPGGQVIYSDPCFITLGEVVRRVTGERIDSWARTHVFQPLGMIDAGYLPAPQVRARIAATEISNEFEHDKVPGAAPIRGGWRTGLIHGEVHDGNAWYGFDGVAGHAGLFATAMDLARYGHAWLTRMVPGISEAVHREAIRSHTDDLPGNTERRGLGWRLSPAIAAGPEDSALGFGSNAYGHTGFTGTSIWIDPDKRIVSVFLSNRVHPAVTSQYMVTRANFNRAMIEAAL